jgi:hypothetical protein
MGNGGAPSSGGAGGGGASASGGHAGSAGSPAGGYQATGGATTVTGGRAGDTGNGGSGGKAAGGAGSGGSSAGGNAAGGSDAGGGTTGGSHATGGSAGSSATGGSRATGGSTTTGGVTGGGGTAGAGGSTHTGNWQIMPLGDSITGTTCYPKLLSQELVDKGHTNFTLVGTVLNNQACGNAPNVQTEGHGGYLVTYLTSDSHKSENRGTMTELLSWAAEKPDVVLLEYGTNDCWTSSIPLGDIVSALGFVVDTFRAQNPNVVVFVAQITPLNPSGCSTCEARVEGLNALIPDWAAGKTTSASPVYVVNVFSALDPKTYLPNSTWTQDGCHPAQPAAQLMADKWYAGLIARGIP